MSLSQFSLEEVIVIHEQTIVQHGGLSGIRDKASLEACLAQPFQTFDNHELYPTVVDKASRFAFGVIRNHPFLDGNKRVGTALLGVYLRANGYIFKPQPDELLKVILSVASGVYDYDDLRLWVEGVVSSD